VSLLSCCLITCTTLQPRRNTVNPNLHPQHNMDHNNNNPYLQFAPVPPATSNGHGTNGNSESDLLTFELMSAFRGVCF
jgi:hypothetical protein